MRKYYLISILFLSLTSQILPQGWFWQNPLPQGNTLNDVDFLDNSFGIAVGNTGTIMKSIDGGLTWSLKESNTSKTIYKVDVVSNEVAYALGYYFIIKTTDGGENWFTITNPTNFYLNDIFFIDELKGYIVGSGGVIFYTSDGGNSWISRNSGTTFILKAVYFINDDIGMAVGYNVSTYVNVIIKTADSGITWTSDFFSLPGGYLFTDVILTTELRAYVISSNGDLLNTIDGGENWLWSNVGSSSNLASIDFIDSLKGFISSVDKIYRTSDGGNNWQMISFSLGESIWLYGISSPTENLIYAAGEFGRMVYSNDAGITWEQISSGPLNSFRDVSFYDENYGIAVGAGIITTSDGGSNWILNSEVTTLTLFRCTRPSLNLCFAAGGYNILKSTDRGFTWTRHPISDDHYFMTISFADTLNGIASAMLGAQGKIFRTFDGDINWQQITSIQGHYIYDICFVDSTTAYACSGSTKVFKTTDGGYTWSLQNTGVSGTILYGIHFVNRNVGYTVGYPGVVIKTVDGGQNWQLLDPNLGNGLGFYQVNFMDENNGLVAGEIVAHTSNGGQTWTGYNLFNDFIESAAMVTDSIWYAVGQYGAILKTTTGGIIPVELIYFNAIIEENKIHLDWVTATETNNQGFAIERKNDFANWKEIGFVEGKGTTTETQYYSFSDNDLKPGRYKYRLKQIDYDGSFEYSKIVEVEIESPTIFSLEQNYPNPYNPTTKIKFELPEQRFVTIKVYDVLGNEIEILVNEEKPAGSYEVEFDASNLSSGIYFYQLRVGSFVETKKMVLLK